MRNGLTVDTGRVERCLLAGLPDNGKPMHVVCGIRGKHFFFAIFASLRGLVLKRCSLEAQVYTEKTVYWIIILMIFDWLESPKQ